MLYLIKNGEYLKIGFTNDINTRMKTYKTHSPNCTLLFTKDGNKKDEILLHKLCNEYIYDREWFYNKPEVVTIFMEYIPQIWKLWTSVTKFLDSFIEKLRLNLENEKFWNIEYIFNYTFLINDSDEWTSCFTMKNLINIPDNYTYYSSLYRLYCDISTLKPWELLCVLYKLNKLTTSEYILYLEKSIQYCNELEEDELSDCIQQIKVKSAELMILENDKLSIKNKYSYLREQLNKNYTSLLTLNVDFEK